MTSAHQREQDLAVMMSLSMSTLGSSSGKPANVVQGRMEGNDLAEGVHLCNCGGAETDGDAC